MEFHQMAIKNSLFNNNNNSIQLFIYLRAELNSRGPITESARNMKTNNNTTPQPNTHKEYKTKNTNKHNKKTRRRQQMLMLIKL
jgi:hypothetical protein